jgi:AcrR family transcriptional regulator
LRTAGKDTQRIRILRGMTHIAANEGYAAATVAKVIAHAGVSRPTFYDYFDNREGCFLAALEEIQEQAFTEIERAVRQACPESAMRASIAAMVTFADSKPTLARVLMVQALTGGPRALDARDRMLEQIAGSIEASTGRLPPVTRAPDISARVVIGAVERLLSARLKNGGAIPSGLLGEILDSLERYEQPIAAHRWRALRPILLSRGPSSAAARLAEPPALAPGRSRLSKEDIEANHRRRLLLAAARASVEKGYAAATFAEIATIAGVDRRIMHRLFRDKQELLQALLELSFQHLMTVTAGAFFTPKSWPERVWDAGLTFTECLEQNRTLAHVAFIETYVGGTAVAQRAEGFLDAFTLFLRDGGGQGFHERSRVALDLIAAGVFETFYRQIRASPSPELSGLLPHVTHLVLLPFLGASAANEFIAQKIEDGTVLP